MRDTDARLRVAATWVSYRRGEKHMQTDVETTFGDARALWQSSSSSVWFWYQLMVSVQARHGFDDIWTLLEHFPASRQTKSRGESSVTLQTTQAKHSSDQFATTSLQLQRVIIGAHSMTFHFFETLGTT